GAMLASDAQPLLEITSDVVFLEHGDLVVATKNDISFQELNSGKTVTRQSTKLDWSVEKLNKQGFPHYMLKEIYEQPAVFVDTVNGLIDRARPEPFSMVPQPGVELLDKAKRLILVACGTSWHAALLGKYWLESLSKIPVSVDLASEFRYRNPVLSDGTVVIGISQSGETADTLAVVRECKKLCVPTVAITNVRGSTLSREADAVFYTSAGPEIGVAATKTFTSQLVVMVLFAGYLYNRSSSANAMLLFDEMIRLPHILSDYLGSESGKENSLLEDVKKAARALVNLRGFFLIGRGYSFPMALEGALKLKEIAYVYAEGYAGGELKHGPIAMIDKNMAVVVLAPKDRWREKTISNLQEVKARGAIVLGIGDAADSELRSLCNHWIRLPEVPSPVGENLLPFLLAPAIQLLSYEIAVLRGTDVDKPRNLAKSVTVE
ncbi:MAG: glutamine--fructose-6-phosphate transaminase (isomerizing), partial [Bdellovibrionota bacterium]